ncbi:hypothetical protein [Neptunicella sp.]|uniref:hypothetical protein n=1 Tax=Neptunicella sp. TaxID=2125986 RepID=UPI003F68F2EB
MMFFAFQLARDLGKSITEILQFSGVEFTYWMAFYKVNQDKQTKALEKAKKATKRNRKLRG